MISADPVSSERIPLDEGENAVVFEAEGLRHPRSARSQVDVFTRYTDVTHVALSERLVWLATRRTVYALPRRRFVGHGGGERLVRVLLGRIGERAGGVEQLARMSEVDALARRPATRRATWGLAVACLAAYVLETLGGPEIFTVGYFSPALVADGDWWRVITATLLHGFPIHLAVNLVGVLVLGRMVERALGSARTLCVMMASALGAMGTSGWLLDGSVVGVSGVAFGLAGAVLWLELRRAAELPAWWRFPRGLLLLLMAAFAIDVGLGFVVSAIAGEAHLGGFAAGAIATALLVRGEGLRRPSGIPARATAAVSVAGAVLAIGIAGVELLRADDFAASHAARLGRLPGVTPDEMNNHAWFIAISEGPSTAQLEAALGLAERAVEETGGSEAAMLDTLAEVQFQLGRGADAVATIDRAIEREPDETYYREQRRRFTGERAAEDRPTDPATRGFDTPPDPPLPPDDHGVKV